MKLTIQKRLWMYSSVYFGVTLVLIIIMSIQYVNSLRTDITSRRQILYERYDQMIRHEVQTVQSLLSAIHKRVLSGELSEEEGKKLSADLVRDLRYGDSGKEYFWIDDLEGNNIVLYGNKAVEGSNRNNLQDARGTYIIQELRKLALAGGGYLDYYFPRQGETNPLPKRSYVQLFAPYGWVVGTGLYVDDMELVIQQATIATRKAQHFLALQIGFFAVLILVIVIIIQRLIHSTISIPLTSIAQEAEKIGEGNFAVTVDPRWKALGGEIEKLADAFSSLYTYISTRESEIMAMSQADFTTRISIFSDSDNLGRALTTLQTSLATLITEVRNSIEQFGLGAEQLSRASQSLSQGASEQASSIEEITSALTEVSAQVKQNNEKTLQARELSREVLTRARESQNHMHTLVEVIDRLNSSAQEINSIVKTIDDIAFQINLLALNANVEAARAGKYGKGFAVVADEVRNLAVKSASSVKETTEKVKDIVASITRSHTLTSEVATTIEVMYANISQSMEVSEEVAASSQEQLLSMQQISQGIHQINQVTQTTASSAEETASAAEELASEAASLKRLISQFKITAREAPSSGAKPVQSPPQEIHHPEPLPGQKTGRVIRLDDDDFGKFWEDPMEEKKHRSSIASRLIVAIGSTITVLLLIMAGVYLFLMTGTFTQFARESIEAHMATAITEVQGWFTTQIPLLDGTEKALSLYSPGDKDLRTKYITTMALYTNAEARSIYIGPKKGPREGGVFYSSDGWIPDADYDWTTRPWFTLAQATGSLIVTAPYIDAIQGDLVISMARPTMTKNVIPGVIAVDMGITTVQNVIARLSVTPTARVYLVDEKGLFITHENTNFILTTNIWQTEEFRDFASLGQSQKFTLITRGAWYAAIYPFRLFNTKWKLVVRGRASDIFGPLYTALGTMLGLGVVMILVVVGILILSGRWLSPLATISQLGEEIARGKFVTPHITHKYQDEIGMLITSFSGIVQSLKIKEQFLLALQEGDFTQDVPIASNEDTVGLALKSMTERLSELIRTIKESVNQTMTSVEQLKKASQHLSQGSTEQAAAVEEITSSVKEIQSQARQNLSLATESIEVMTQLLRIVEDNQNQLNHLRDTMQKNTEASEQIKAVVKTIDDIAFQINLLALNANVEAARAGKYGKGFAVVADEVRNLAVKSAQAAKDTAQIVDQTVTNLLKSDEMLKQTFDKFALITSQSEHMNQKMKEIGELSQAQSLGLDQISQGLGQISVAVQAAAASAEETASAASELAGQTQELQRMIQFFKTR